MKKEKKKDLQETGEGGWFCLDAPQLAKLADDYARERIQGIDDKMRRRNRKFLLSGLKRDFAILCIY